MRRGWPIGRSPRARGAIASNWRMKNRLAMRKASPLASSTCQQMQNGLAIRMRLVAALASLHSVGRNCSVLFSWRANLWPWREASLLMRLLPHIPARHDIAAAITAGAENVQAVGATCKAGTNFGSCRSDIARMLPSALPQAVE